METDLFFDYCFEILAALVSYLNKNRRCEGASGSLFIRVGGRGTMDDVFLAHGGMLVWNLALWKS